MLNFLPLLHTQTLHFPTLNIPFHTFIRRTSGHCLETSRSVSRPPTYDSSVFHCTPLLLLILQPSYFRVSPELQRYSFPTFVWKRAYNMTVLWVALYHVLTTWPISIKLHTVVMLLEVTPSLILIFLMLLNNTMETHELLSWKRY
jgi:hypothetical protein